MKSNDWFRIYSNNCKTRSIALKYLSERPNKYGSDLLIL